jgi:mono/diheme cytochrome c family protein
MEELMKSVIFIVILLLSTFAYAEKNKSEIQSLPSYLKGIDSNGKLLRHGYILWLEKRPYTPLVDSELAKKGGEIYTKNCLQCHGAKGEGDGPVSKKYGVKAADIRNSGKTLNNHTLFIQVSEGRGDMPQWVDLLTEEDIWALTHYLHSLK